MALRRSRSIVSLRRALLRFEVLEGRRLLATGAGGGHQPTSFEPNAGQADPEVRFLAHGIGYALYLTPGAALLNLSKSAGNPSGAVVGMQLVGSNAGATVAGQDRLPGVTNYYIGNDPSQWRAGVPNYGQVVYRGVYPGIDTVYHGEAGQLEYDFDVAPGADPGRIALAFSGVSAMSLNGSGELVLHASGGDVIERAPVAYQVVNGRQVAVPVRFVLRPGGTVSFALGGYDRTRPLVIDPVLSYATYLGGSSQDIAYAVGVDAAGDAIVSGFTASLAFPTRNPSQTQPGGGVDVFVTKFSADGQTLLYSTYFGGGGDEDTLNVAVDPAGTAYLTGYTTSTNFPRKNPIQSKFGGGSSDGFVTKLSPLGTLVYSTYLGGTLGDSGEGIAIDKAGHAFVAGYTSSGNFPTKNPFQQNYGGGTFDAFAAKLSTDGGSLLYSTFLGGSTFDSGSGIAVDAAGTAYVSGFTDSTNYFTKNALQPMKAGLSDLFVTALNSAGSPVYSTYFGAEKDDQALGIATLPDGTVFLTGFTFSTMFLAQVAVQGSNHGNADAFVLSLAPGGQAVNYSTYLGGMSADVGRSIAVDSSGAAYVTGHTQSTDFPMQNAVQPKEGGAQDAFVAVLSPGGRVLRLSTPLGGSADEDAFGIAVDRAGVAYIAGETASLDFPTRHPFQSGLDQSTAPADAFLAKIRGYPLTRVTPSDFDGDDRTDFAVYLSNAYFVKPSGGGAPIVVSLGSAGAIPVAGDYDVDGKIDFGVFANNTFTVKTSRGPTLTQAWGGPGAIPVVGDFDGDRATDFAIYINGTYVIKPSNGGPPIVQPWSMPGSTPVVGDYDGDARADFGIYAGGTFFIKLSGGGTLVQPWSAPGGIPVVGDYDGDGKSDFAIYAGNTFFVKPSNGSPAFAQRWGVPGSTPIEGDYDGDGKTDFAFYFSNAFFVKPSAGGPTISQSWGIPGAIPLPVPLPFLNGGSRGAGLFSDSAQAAELPQFVPLLAQELQPEPGPWRRGRR